MVENTKTFPLQRPKEKYLQEINDFFLYFPIYTWPDVPILNKTEKYFHILNWNSYLLVIDLFYSGAKVERGKLVGQIIQCVRYINFYALTSS